MQMAQAVAGDRVARVGTRGSLPGDDDTLRPSPTGSLFSPALLCSWDSDRSRGMGDGSLPPGPNPASGTAGGLRGWGAGARPGGRREGRAQGHPWVLVRCTSWGSPSCPSPHPERPRGLVSARAPVPSYFIAMGFAGKMSREGGKGPCGGRSSHPRTRSLFPGLVPPRFWQRRAKNPTVTP